MSNGIVTMSFDIPVMSMRIATMSFDIALMSIRLAADVRDKGVQPVALRSWRPSLR
jgi:hypothetical protein